jgi:hypothetical protein
MALKRPEASAPQAEWDGWWARELRKEQRGQPVYIPQLPFPPDLFTGMVNMNGINYPLRQTLSGSNGQIGANYQGFADGVYKGNSIVYAIIAARLNLLSQARFQWQQLRNGRPGDLFGTPALGILEVPEPGKVTADLISHASLDVDLAGNAFIARRIINGSAQLKRMRPDWVTIVMGSQSDENVDARDIDAEVVGYVYYPGGRTSGLAPEFLLRDTVAHMAPIPDPLHRFRGMSWITPIIREIQADSAASAHKELFFENGATPNMIVKIDTSIPEKFKETVNLVEAGHTGLANAYKTLYLAAGVDATVVGSNFQQIDFAVTQAAGETRLATAGGIHPVILGLREGLQGSSLNQGNFMAARRLTADLTLRPWWGSFCASLEVIVPPPGGGARLWYDDRHIPFLAEDIKDAADVQSTNASAIRALIDGGFKADSVVDAVTAGDLSRLKGAHTGLFSVQLQAPGSTKMPAGEVPGETPVGSGIKPETLPAGAESVKPVTGATTKPKPTPGGTPK